MKRRQWLLAAVGGLVSAVPARAEDVTLADTALATGRGTAAFFVATEVDGRTLDSHALIRTRRASVNLGPAFNLKGDSRPLPAGRPVRIALLATEADAAPVQTLFRSMFGSRPPPVQGTVEVSLAPGGRYRVNGALDPGRREVWIEDERGEVVAGSRIALSQNPEVEKAMQGAVYTRINLRYDGDWIGDGPSPDLPFVPAGARLKVLEFGRGKATVLVEGSKMRVGVDWAEGRETVPQMVERITTAQDPRPAMAAWPQPVRDAVRSGKVRIGMTREQALVALGPPRPDLTPALDVGEWAYVLGNGDEAFLVFGADGRLREVDASRRARALLLAAGTADGTPAGTATGAGVAAPAAASAPT